MKNPKTINKRILSILLTLILLITNIPLTAIAEDNDPTPPEQTLIERLTELGLTIHELPEQEKEPADILFEIKAERTQYSKTYLRTDKTFVTISSADALHYHDENEYWQDIDNTLIIETNANGDEVVTNTENDFSVELPTIFDEYNIVKVEKDGYNLSFKLIDNEDIQESESNITEVETNADYEDLENKSSQVEYIDVLPDTDIVYDIKPQSIKESIILNTAPNGAVTYTYEITAPNLIAELQEDNSIRFYADEEEPQFIMPAPYMFDSSDVFENSRDIDVTLDEIDDGIYILTYTPSIDWLTDEIREYPVTIDPTVLVNNNISHTSIDISMGLEEPLFLGSMAGLDFIAYYKWNVLPQLPNNAIIDNASFNLSMIPHSGGSYTNNTISAYELLSGWGATNPTLGALADVQSYVSSSVTFNITDLVDGWYNNNNNGIVLNSNNLPCVAGTAVNARLLNKILLDVPSNWKTVTELLSLSYDIAMYFHVSSLVIAVVDV